MTEVSPSLSVTILNLNELNHPIKRQIGRVDFLKAIIQLYTFYKKLILDQKTQIGLKVKEWKKIHFPVLAIRSLEVTAPS